MAADNSRYPTFTIEFLLKPVKSFRARETPTAIEPVEIRKNKDIQRYCRSNAKPPSINTPVNPGPIAEPRTMTAAANDLIAHKYLVP